LTKIYNESIILKSSIALSKNGFPGSSAGRAAGCGLAWRRVTIGTKER